MYTVLPLKVIITVNYCWRCGCWFHHCVSGRFCAHVQQISLSEQTDAENLMFQKNLENTGTQIWPSSWLFGIMSWLCDEVCEWHHQLNRSSHHNLLQGEDHEPGAGTAGYRVWEDQGYGPAKSADEARGGESGPADEWGGAYRTDWSPPTETYSSQWEYSTIERARSGQQQHAREGTDRPHITADLISLLYHGEACTRRYWQTSYHCWPHITAVPWWGTHEKVLTDLISLLSNSSQSR